MSSNQTKSNRYEINSEMVTKYCASRLIPYFHPPELTALRAYLIRLVLNREYPPYLGVRLSLPAIAAATGINVSRLKSARPYIRPVFDAVARAVAENAIREPQKRVRELGREARNETVPTPSPSAQIQLNGERKRRGPAPKPIVEFPDALEMAWSEPDCLADALKLQAKRHGDSIYHLYKAVIRPNDNVDIATIMHWVRGKRTPRSLRSLEILGRIDKRYRLPDGYFKQKIDHPTRAATGYNLGEISRAECRRLAWHLPDDFNQRSRKEREEILDWVRTVIISGATDYRRYQAAASRQRFALRFDVHTSSRRRLIDPDTDESCAVTAPKRLREELIELLEFKTSTFAAFGLQRNGVWGDETAEQKVEHFALWFGAFAASPESDVRGFGADPGLLTFSMMVFPQVWDWYLQWRERRRGFFTKWESDVLAGAAALTREETGWLRQTPRIAGHLREIPGLISKADIEAVMQDWDGACTRMYRHARRRIKEIERVAKVHRDPFEPILPVLEAASPLAEYRKITEEILRSIPDERRFPVSAAEAVRAFLLLRIALHTGLRPRNLREMMLCKRGQLPTSERRLEDMKRGELRWSARDDAWEIFIPAVAFKNATSSFFGQKPFRLFLLDLGKLYEKLEAYIDRHRERLLEKAPDPGTFFVKTVKITSKTAAYNQFTFYEAWRLTIQRYGIRNPYTGKGAIEGLLPHGPHNVRDVLATHILKQTGSYEQASYAIQDTPEMVAQHYGRFLPQDKAEIAARILNKVWEAA